ncbi:Uncharacterized protein Adt_18474 [Abeliophyllum distichum]|uniref:Uncharacterized protein n=1 Tax=Abeliophyllum distichum TaxID=126358 RepID=A0ABD1TJN4_9LAMI
MELPQAEKSDIYEIIHREFGQPESQTLDGSEPPNTQVEMGDNGMEGAQRAFWFTQIGASWFKEIGAIWYAYGAICALKYGVIIFKDLLGLNVPTPDASAIEETKALALATVPSANNPAAHTQQPIHLGAHAHYK